MKNRRKNKLVKPVGREYRGLLALGSLFPELENSPRMFYELVIPLPKPRYERNIVYRGMSGDELSIQNRLPFQHDIKIVFEFLGQFAIIG